MTSVLWEPAASADLRKLGRETAMRIDGIDNRGQAY